jgi:hypothetical protein
VGQVASGARHCAAPPGRRVVVAILAEIAHAAAHTMRPGRVSRISLTTGLRSGPTTGPTTGLALIAVEKRGG